VEVVDLIGTIVGEICVTVGLGGGVFWGAVRVVPGNEVLAFPVLEFVGALSSESSQISRFQSRVERKSYGKTILFVVSQ
jgi:hypothetical protein